MLVTIVGHVSECRGNMTDRLLRQLQNPPFRRFDEFRRSLGFIAGEQIQASTKMLQLPTQASLAKDLEVMVDMGRCGNIDRKFGKKG